MAIAEELIAGVVSSVLAVVLVEIYLLVRRRYRRRALRWLIGTETASVVTPDYPWAEHSHPSGLLTTYDAIGLAHVLEACNRLGTVPVITRSGESAENSPLDVIAIGGPSGNQVSATFLKAYCPGFEILTDPETGRLSYRCGGRVFARTDDETFAFIVRLSPHQTGLPGTALIAWGHSAVSTATAGYFLARYPDTLRKVSKGSFFVAISVRWVLGYRSFDTRPIDLTEAAFAPPPPPPALPDPEPEEPRSRRFGRSRRSSSVASEPIPVPVSGTVLGGRSRVAQALDDVRAGSGELPAPVSASAGPVASAESPVVGSSGRSRPSAETASVASSAGAESAGSRSSAARGTSAPAGAEPASSVESPPPGEASESSPEPEPPAKPAAAPRRGRSPKS